MTVEAPLILVLEDEEGIAELVSEVLESEGLAVVAARTPEEALRVLEGDRRPAAMVLDLVLGGGDGTEFYRTLQQRGLAIPAVIVSGRGDAASRAAEIDAGFVAKPFDLDDLVLAVRRAAGLA